jgi:hypothetical protein
VRGITLNSHLNWKQAKKEKGLLDKGHTLYECPEEKKNVRHCRNWKNASVTAA